MTHEYLVRRVSDRLVEVEHPTGFGTMLMSYLQSERSLTIHDLNVVHQYRRQGVAREMAEYTKYIAEQIGATAILATIVSREAYELALTITGPESLNINKLANFIEPCDGSEPGRPYDSDVELAYQVIRP